MFKLIFYVRFHTMTLTSHAESEFFPSSNNADPNQMASDESIRSGYLVCEVLAKSASDNLTFWESLEGVLKSICPAQYGLIKKWFWVQQYPDNTSVLFPANIMLTYKYC